MKVGRGKRVVFLSALAVAVLAVAPSTSFAAECEPIMPTSAVMPGMVGSGLSVVRGRTPEPFSIEVLGVLRNEIGPGRDMIIVEATSPAIERAGGIWFGMSGSPVYVGGQLIGALGYGFGSAAGPSAIAGITPAPDMAQVLSYPVSARSLGSADLPAAVKLTPAIRRAIAEATDTSAAFVPSTMTRLRVPLSVSGLSARGLARVQEWADKKKLAFVPYSGSSAPRTQAAPGTTEPGGNFAAAISYGDITAAGIGTTTYVCNGRALAFGHPFFFGGDTLMGANTADALAVVHDPVWGPYKLASIAESLGRVDQDRLAAIGATLGASPPATPIRTTVTARNLNTSRDGATDVVLRDETPFLAFMHVLSNIDSTFDSIGKGSAELSWTISGTRADGTPWSLARSNVYASPFDIAYESAEELGTQLDFITFNPFEDVEFTGVQLTATVDKPVRLYTISRLLVQVKKGGAYRARQVVRVRPNQLLRFKAIVKPFERGSDWTFAFSVRVPKRFNQTFGLVEVSGAPGFPRICFSENECEGGTLVKTFDGLLKALDKQPKNNILTANHRAGERMKVKSKRVWDMNGVVRGYKAIYLMPPGGGSDGGEGDVSMEGP